MAQKIEVSDAAQLLLQQNNILILTHQSPDGDTLGSGFGLYYALKQRGKRAALACSDEIYHRYEILYNHYQEESFEPGFIVAVDIADTQLFGSKLEKYIGRVNLCIDHHPSNTLYAEKVLLDPSAAATAQLMFHLLSAMQIRIDKQIANCLYTGLATDTGCFRFSNTSSETHRVAAAMIDAGAEIGPINRAMFDIKTPGRLAIEGMVLESIEYAFDGKAAMICISQKMLRETGVQDGELDGLAGLPRQIEGVEAGVTFKEKEKDVFKISLRTSQFLDASKICGALGGGGHARAAGCLLKGSYAQVKEQFLQQLKRALEQA